MSTPFPRDGAVARAASVLLRSPAFTSVCPRATTGTCRWVPVGGAVGNARKRTSFPVVPLCAQREKSARARTCTLANGGARTRTRPAQQRCQVLQQDGKLEEFLRITPATSGDSQFMRVGNGDLRGGFELRVGAHDLTTLRFCGREFREAGDFGNQFQANEHWPRQAVFGDAADQPERATPHGSVVFTRRPAMSKHGRLLVQHAVFLPLNEAEEMILPGTWDYCLFLHSFYFVDSSRRHVEWYSDLPEATAR